MDGLFLLICIGLFWILGNKELKKHKTKLNPNLYKENNAFQKLFDSVINKRT